MRSFWVTGRALNPVMCPCNRQTEDTERRQASEEEASVWRPPGAEEQGSPPQSLWGRAAPQPLALLPELCDNTFLLF